MPEGHTLATLLVICNYIVLPQWILMMLFPRWKWTHRLVDSYGIVYLLGALYVYFFILVLPKFRSGYSMLTFVRILFSSRRVLLVFWLHILIFDLVVGSWVCRDAVKCGLSWWKRVISLFLIFVTGPIGFILYEGILKPKNSKGQK